MSVFFFCVCCFSCLNCFFNVLVNSFIAFIVVHYYYLVLSSVTFTICFWHAHLLLLSIDCIVPFESLAKVSYSYFVATMAVSLAVCEIFSVKE